MKKKNLLLTVVVILGLTTISIAQTVPTYVPTNGLVGWWPFNGNANDESGNGNNGTINGAALTSDRFGNTSSAYSFDGLSAFITAPKNYTFNNSITFNVWANITTLSGVQTLFSSWGSNSNLRTFTIYYESQYYRNSIQTINNQEYAFSNQPPVANVWTMLTGTYDGNTLTIYENGQLISSTLTSGSNFNLNQYNFYNFGTEDQLIQFYNGKLDDIGIWNRALTQQEITDLFNAVNCANNTTISPQTNTLTLGGTAIFNATTSDPNPSYVWQSNFGQGFQTLNDYGNYSGVNTNSLSISNVQLSEHNQPIRVISTSGECIDTSNVATININDTCIVTINDTITTLISVTDTLVINTLISGLTPPNNSNTIKVFPNPANSHVTIDFGNFASMNGYILNITNSIGQIVYTTSINQQSSYVDLSTWGGNGIYFVQIIDTQNNTIENRKIVLQ